MGASDDKEKAQALVALGVVIGVVGTVGALFKAIWDLGSGQGQAKKDGDRELNRLVQAEPVGGSGFRPARPSRSAIRRAAEGSPLAVVHTSGPCHTPLIQSFGAPPRRRRFVGGIDAPRAISRRLRRGSSGPAASPVAGAAPFPLR
jgi:hypothetical protein